MNLGKEGSFNSETFSYTEKGVKASCDAGLPYSVVQYRVILHTACSGNGNTMPDLAAEGSAERSSWIVAADGNLSANLYSYVEAMEFRVGPETGRGCYNVAEIVEYTTPDGRTLKRYMRYFSGWAYEGSGGQGDPARLVGNTVSLAKGQTTLDLYPVMTDCDEDYIICYSNGAQYCVGYLGTSGVWNIPAGVNYIEFYNFVTAADTPAVTTINLPASLVNITNFPDNAKSSDKVDFASLTAINVDSANANLCSQDGVLYTADGTSMIKVPYALTQMPSWNAACTTLRGSGTANTACFSGSNIKELIIPEQVKNIGMSFDYGQFEKITIEATEGLTLNNTFMCEFENNCTWILKSQEPPALSGYAQYGEGKQTILVPDSENDKVYQKYLLCWGETIGNKVGDDQIYAYLNTESGAGDGYAYNRTLQTIADSATGTVLCSSPLQASGTYTVPSDYTAIGGLAFSLSADISQLIVPETVAVLENSAFAGADHLLNIRLESETVLAPSEHLFGDAINAGLKITVPDSLIGQYIETWQPVIDAEYGEGATLELFTASNYLTIDGILYKENEDDTLTAIKASASILAAALDKRCVSVNAGCFAGCEDLEILVLPASLTDLEEGAFTGCTALKVLAENAAPAPDWDGAVFGNLNKDGLRLLVPEGTDYSRWEKTLALEAESFGITYTLEADSNGNNIVYGTSEDSVKTAVYVSKYAAGILNFQTSEPNAIAAGACRDNSGIEVLYLGKNTTEVDAEAFAGCTSLRRVLVYGPTNSWGKDIFTGCTALTEFSLCSPTCNEIPAGFADLVGLDAITSLNIYGTASIGEGAFRDHPTLATVTVRYYTVYQGGLKSIGDSAFAGCRNLTSFKFANVINNADNRLQTIGKDAFADCTSLTTFEWYNVTNRNSLTYIGDGAFENCALQTVYIPVNVSYVGESAFSMGSLQVVNWYTAINPEIAMFGPDGNALTTFYLSGTAAPDNAFFANFPALTTLYWYSTTNPTAGNLSNLSALTTLYLSESLTVIPEDFCAGDSGLRTVRTSSYTNSNIGTLNLYRMTNLSQIGSRAFYGVACTNLWTPKAGPSFGEEVFSASSLVYEYWYSTTSPGTGTFKNCEDLTTVTITTSISSLPGECFAGCTGLSKLSVPETVTSLGDRCFGECPLASLTFAGTAPASLGADLFGSAAPEGLAITVPTSDEDAVKAAYWTAWHEQLDAAYGSEYQEETYKNSITAKWLDYIPQEEEASLLGDSDEASLLQNEDSDADGNDTEEDVGKESEKDSEKESEKDAKSDAKKDGSEEEEKDQQSNSEDSEEKNDQNDQEDQSCNEISQTVQESPAVNNEVTGGGQ